MDYRFGIQGDGRFIWTWRKPSQFRITSEQGASDHIIIEGHDISTLLDYLYDHRELIYEATHDQETQLLEVMESLDSLTGVPPAGRRVEPILYFDDGIERTKAKI